jgi:hypothetical protein
MFVFEQDAVVQFHVVDGELQDCYSATDVTFLDSGLVTCTHCQTDSDDSEELMELCEFLLDLKEETHDISRQSGRGSD